MILKSWTLIAGFAAGNAMSATAGIAATGAITLAADLAATLAAGCAAGNAMSATGRMIDQCVSVGVRGRQQICHDCFGMRRILPRLCYDDMGGTVY